MAWKFEPFERAKFAALRQLKKLDPNKHLDEIRKLEHKIQECEKVANALNKNREMNQKMIHGMKKFNEAAAHLFESLKIAEEIGDYKNEKKRLEEELRIESRLGQKICEDLQAELENVKTFERKAVEAGYNILKHKEMLEAMREIPEVKIGLAEALEDLKDLRKSVADEYKEFIEAKLKDTDATTKAKIEEMSKFQEQVAELRERLEASDDYETPEAAVPRKGESFSLKCPYGRTHDGPWMHISLNNINCYEKNTGWRIEADGQGRYQCQDCYFYFDLVNECQFACDCKKDKYWRHPDRPAAQKAAREGGHQLRD